MTRVSTRRHTQLNSVLTLPRSVLLMSTHGRSTIPLLREVLARTVSDNHIVVGDFNLHHPLWGGERHHQHDNEAEELLQLIGEYQMELLLPPGSVTFDERGGQTTIDLAFGTPWVQQRKIFCGVREDLDHQSDHFPVATAIMTEVETCVPPERRQWQRTNPDTLRRELGQALPPLAPLLTEGEIDRRSNELVAAITGAIAASTPMARPSERSVPGWT